MPLLDMPVKLVAHQHQSLSLALTDESGKRKYVSFASGYAEVVDSEVLQQLLESPLRGPSRPKEFMIVASDEKARELIKTAQGDNPTPKKKIDYSEMSLQEALEHVFKSKPHAILTFDFVMKAILDGGYETKSKNFGTIARSAIRTLEQKGAILVRGTDEWQAAD